MVGAVMGVGGAGAGITAAYSLGAFGGSDVDSAGTSKPINFSNVHEEWKVSGDSSNFIGQGSVPDCVKKMFPGITAINTVPGYNSANNTKTSFSLDENKESNGCLITHLERQESEDASKSDKYTGKFVLLWSFSQENKGFISYVSFSFEWTENSKAKALGLLYSLSKEEDGNENWKMTSKYELSTSFEIDRNKVPKPGSALNGFENKSLWGLEENKNIDNLVRKSELGTTKLAEEGGSYWKWRGPQGNKKLKDWSSNLDDWWGEVFKDSNNKDLPGQLVNITGSWEKIANEDLKVLSSE